MTDPWAARRRGVSRLSRAGARQMSVEPGDAAADIEALIRDTGAAAPGGGLQQGVKAKERGTECDDLLEGAAAVALESQHAERHRVRLDSAARNRDAYPQHRRASPQPLPGPSLVGFQLGRVRRLHITSMHNFRSYLSRRRSSPVRPCHCGTVRSLGMKSVGARQQRAASVASLPTSGIWRIPQQS